MSALSEKQSFIIVTDIGSDADDSLAIIQIVNVLRHLRRHSRIAFVLSMLNPSDKAIFVNHMLSLVDLKGLELEVEIYIAKGFCTLEEATEIHPNFPPRFGPVYDQLQGIDVSAVDKSNIYPVDKLFQFTDKCAEHSAHLLVLSPVSMVDYIDFSKVNLETVHMMAGIAIRNGVKKIGYNVGVSPEGFVKLCQKTEGKMTIVTPSVCDSVRMAVDFEKVKQLIRLDGVSNFIFGTLMRWHLYITKKATDFLNLGTPCISDLVAADLFLRKVFPEYNGVLRELLRSAVEDRELNAPDLSVGIGSKPTSFSMNLNYKNSYLDDTEGELFEAKEGTLVHCREAELDFSTVCEANYGTYLVASVFAH